MYVLYNPMAGNGHGDEKAREIEKKVQGQKIEYRDVTRMDAADFLARLPMEETVVLAGGDGTLNHFINRYGSSVLNRPLYYFPAGSGNDFWNDVGQNSVDGMILLNDYLENLPAVTDIDLNDMFEQLSKGEQSAVQTLASYYMKATAELAADMNAKEILLADLIQEANLSLIQALDNAGEELRDEEWLLAEVRKGILQVIEEQTQVKFADDSLVARVEKLESAVRELNDDEDDKNAFSIDELAIILDMKVDEIRDILRLTGDDK